MLHVNLKDRILIYQLVVALTAVTLILIGCLIIIKPFVPAILLSTIFTLATWPAFTWLQARLRHRVAPAATLMTLALSACFLVPLVIIGNSVIANYEAIYSGVMTFLKSNPETSAKSLEQVPYVGDMLEKYWVALMSDREKMIQTLQEYARPTSTALLDLAATIGRGILDITLGIIISYFFFRHGMHVAVRIRALIDKFGGEYGEKLLKVSKDTLIGVVYGILGTAFLQGVFAAIGFLIANIPGATFLGLMTFFLSLLPMGPPLIWGPAAVWLYTQGQTGMAAFLAIWGVVVIASVDNFMKPYFISRGSDLPLLLVLLGIMGGAIAFGFIGIFLGPTLLALAYAMVIEWTTTRGRASENGKHHEKKD